jgi:DNA-directed DNA polymerase III PolC
VLASPHCHAESYLTGSTVPTMVAKAKELGRTHFAYTDHGHLSSAMAAYKLCKKQGLKFIPGIEIYFKDSSCPIIVGKKADRCKYFTATLHCHDQEAYQELCKIVSRTDMPTTKIYDERQQLWGWNDLKRISKFNVSIVLGGVHCMVGKVMLAGEPDLANWVFTKIREIFSNRVRVALLCEPWSKKWYKIAEVKYTDGTKDVFMPGDLVTTNRARRIRAMDLVHKKGHHHVEAKYSNAIQTLVGKDIDSVILHKGFLPLPGGDISLRVNEFMRGLAAQHLVPLIVTDYAYYANKEDKVVQTMILEGKDQLRPDLYMKSESDIVRYLASHMKMGRNQIISVLENTERWASQFDDFEFKYEWHLADVGEDPLKQAMDIIHKNGRMHWDDPVWVSRLKEELDVIARNPEKDLTAYFLPIRDVLNTYKENGLLTGPGRGSSGGSLFCYLLGITQVNPFQYDLPFNRFFSVDRIMMNELPDIDVDLEDRELLVGSDGKSGYLYGKYGNKAAQISTKTTVRLKSAIKDTNRYFNGKVDPDIDLLTEGLPPPPQGVPDDKFVFGYSDDDGNEIVGLIDTSEDLKKYATSRPKEWDVVQKAMGITRSFSQHASAFVLSDMPIEDTMPTRDGHITQYSAKDVESAKLIKYDFLVVSQLKDIRVCLDMINKKNGDSKVVGNFTHDGKDTYIWDLPEISEVFKSIWDGSTETLFQINTMSMIPVVKDMLPNSIMDIATVQALVRPGPMDYVDPSTGRNMVQEYLLRRKGESDPDIKELADILPETYGIIVYQEQLTRIGRSLAGFSGTEAENLRKHMAKKNMVELMKIKPSFMEGATKKVVPGVAEAIWERMVTFGRYGFSIIHAVEYSLITYACMFLKHFYPLEWWAAVLTNAKETEISGEFWRYVKGIVLPPDINLSSDIMVVDYENNKIRSKLGVIRGLGEKNTEPLVTGRPYADIQDFVNKDVAGPALAHKLIHVGVLDSLFPSRMSIVEKLKMYEDCVQKFAFAEKVRNAEITGKKLRLLKPKEGEIPENYINLHPIKDAAMRKSVLPSLPIDLHTLGKKYSKSLVEYTTLPAVMSPKGYRTPLVDGETMKRLDDLPGENIPDDKYFASTCFVIEAKEFSYSKGTRRALKLILDSDGYVSEKVLWPDYNSGQLVYPDGLAKGAIATFFFRKRPGKKDVGISAVVIET